MQPRVIDKQNRQNTQIPSETCRNVVQVKPRDLQISAKIFQIIKDNKELLTDDCSTWPNPGK